MNAKKSITNLDEQKEVYILKIYRREGKTMESLVGTIEEIHGDRKGVFKTEKDLIDWLKKPEPNE